MNSSDFSDFARMFEQYVEDLWLLHQFCFRISYCIEFCLTYSFNISQSLQRLKGQHQLFYMMEVCFRDSIKIHKIKKVVSFKFLATKLVSMVYTKTIYFWFRKLPNRYYLVSSRSHQMKKYPFSIILHIFLPKPF